MNTRPNLDPRDPSAPTIGELERRVAQRLQKLWQKKTGQFPQRAVALFFERKLVVFMDGVLTPLEQTLSTTDFDRTVLRQTTDGVLKAEVAHLLGKLLPDTGVETILIDTCISENCTGIMAYLDRLPTVRNLKAVPKNGKK